MMYASNVWAQATDLECNRSQINALQRGFAQKVSRSYRTVSLTSALVLSGLLPLDLRIQEAANLYRMKRNLSRDYLPPHKDLEQNVRFLDQPHPSTLSVVEFELLETIPEQFAGPQIYTDGSKIDGQVGAALTWWENGREINFSTYKLHSECTVFQSELFALCQATQMVKSSSEPIVHILSDSRSSLELLRNPKVTHPLAKSIRENVGMISAEGRSVRMYWLRAHVGTAGNERADELAKMAALSCASPDYACVPLSYVKKKIREETVRKWQDRYNSSSTGIITKMFFPDINKAYRVLRSTTLSPFHVQALTGHGGIAQYLYTHKLKDNPGCECDSAIPETVCHVLLKCPRFAAARHDLENQIDKKLIESDLHNILTDPLCRPHFLSFIERSFRIAYNRNSTLNKNSESSQSSTTIIVPEQQTHPQPSREIPPDPITSVNLASKQINIILIDHLLVNSVNGPPGIRIRGVALFMDSPKERLGISFCLVRNRKRIRLSPGLACLLNGSTTKTTMKRKTYDAMPVTEVLGCPCRLVRSRNKTVILFEWADQTPFTQASSFLYKLADIADQQARVISVDAMRIELGNGEAGDRLGCIKASEKHEVVVYEDRGENLNYLIASRHDGASTTDCWGDPVPGSTLQSGSERAQQRVAEERAAAQQNNNSVKSSTRISVIQTAINIAAQNLFCLSSTSLFRTRMTPSATQQQNTRTRANMGQVSPPRYIPVVEPLDHVRNAFLEFIAITRATRQVNEKICEDILQSYRLEIEGLLMVRLKEAEGAIFDNDTSQVIKGNMSGTYMAAYNSTTGFVNLDEAETERSGMPKYAAPSTDPIVVTTRYTKIMLDDRILKMAKTIGESTDVNALWKNWEVPNIQWVNGVPGCGKTTWVIRHFDMDKDAIITTTTEAAKDLREKLAHRVGDLVKTRVRTMASVLVNGFKNGESYSRLMVDEALMNHFGAIVMAARLSGARELVLIGDVNQLPYIDRDNLFELRYHRPNLVANISQELLCTHRNPMDVAYALREIYSGVYSSVASVKSLEQKRFTGSRIPCTQQNTLFLVHTQDEKDILSKQGVGKGTGSRILTIHEAQGLTYESVIALKTKAKMKLHDSVPHAVVAISRHTKTFKYYADDEDDAIGRFVRRAMAASPKAIIEYNFKMAVKDRNVAVVEALKQMAK